MLRPMRLVTLLIAGILLGAPARAATTVIYLNRCAAGCTITPGFDDSRTDTSSIVSQTQVLSAFGHGDTSFASVLACVQSLFAPFDADVTDADPGSADHFEIDIAGTPQQLGLQAGVLDISPLTCSVVSNGMAFAFANTIGDDPQQICVAAAQTVGNLVGLEFVTPSCDVMGFSLTGCQPKGFLDEASQCGDTMPHACICGGTTQNSYQRLLATLPEPDGAAAGVAAVLGLAALVRRSAPGRGR